MSFRVSPVKQRSVSSREEVIYQRLCDQAFYQMQQGSTLQHNSHLVTVLNDFRVTAIRAHVPDFFQYYMVQRLLDCSSATIQDVLVNETNRFKTNSSIFHTITEVVKTREACLKSLHKSLADYSTTRAALETMRTEICNLRELTAHFIRHMQEWREKLLEWGPQVEPIKFFFGTYNYVEKILSDNEFLKHSEMGAQITFDQGDDPFLVRPAEDSVSSLYWLFSLEPQLTHKYRQAMRDLTELQTQGMRLLKRRPRAKPERTGQNGPEAEVKLTRNQSTDNKQMSIINIYKLKGSESSKLGHSLSLSKLLSSPVRQKVVSEDERGQPFGSFDEILRKKQLGIIQSEAKNLRRYSSQNKVSINIGSLADAMETLQTSSPLKLRNFLKAPPLQIDPLAPAEIAVSQLRESVIKEMKQYETVKARQAKVVDEEKKSMEQLKRDVLQKQTMALIQKYREAGQVGKVELAHDLRASSVFSMSSGLDLELKKQLELKLKRDVHKAVSSGRETLPHPQPLSAEEMQMRIRQEAEQRFSIIEKQEQLKAKKRQLDQEEDRRTLLEAELQKTIHQKKKRLQLHASQQRVQLESELREEAKRNLLGQLQEEKQAYFKEKRKQEELKLKQQQFRTQLKNRISEELNITHLIHSEEKRKDRKQKLSLINEAMGQVAHNSQKVDNSRLSQETSPQTFDPQEITFEKISAGFRRFPVLTEEEKQRQRRQFEAEFTGAHKNIIISDNLEVPVKDFRKTLDSAENFQAKAQSQPKIQELGGIQEQNTPQASLNASRRQSQSELFVRYSQASQPIVSEERAAAAGMNIEEFKIYLKQKSNMSKHTTESRNLTASKPIYSKGEEWQNVPSLQNLQHETFEQNLILTTPQIFFNNQVKNESSLQIQKEKTYQFRNNSPQKQGNQSRSKYIKNKKQARVSNRNAFLTQSSASQLSFEPEQYMHYEQKDQKRKSQISLVKKPILSRSQSQTMVQTIYLTAEELPQYFAQHFKTLPKALKHTLFFKQNDLIKQLTDANWFSILQVIKDSVSLGYSACTAINKSGERCLELVHAGTYREEDLLLVVRESAKKLMEEDPCSQVSLSMLYDAQKSEQSQFVSRFQQSFDSYGVIYMKKIFNTQNQIKFVIRRSENQVCQHKLILPHRDASILNNNNLIVLGESHADQLLASSKHVQTTAHMGTLILPSIFVAAHQYKQQVIQHLQTQENPFKKHFSRLVEMLHKSQAKLSQLEMTSYLNIFNLNINLIKKRAEPLLWPDSILEQTNETKLLCYNEGLRLPFSNQFLKSQFQIQGATFNCSYIRYNIGKDAKAFTVQSKLYSTPMHIFPTGSKRLKTFIMSSAEFDGLRIELQIYLRLFLSNMGGHSLAQWQNAWIPMFNLEATVVVSQLSAFGLCGLNRLKVSHQAYSYMKNSLKAVPSHRDLHISPPFIYGVIDATIESSVEGSPLFLAKVDLGHLVNVERKPEPIPDSD